MRFHADLHIHSKYSRATSRDLDLEHLTAWACRKGVTVVGTGDFTHPAWRAELKQKLVPAEPGLFRLRDDLARAVAAELPPACRIDVRFMLQVEISTIYKKGDRTRKVHHLIYAPDFATADRFSDALGKIGNITSDGRPILGLDSRHLLEIALNSGPGAYLIPAHIWTPWFAVLGSMSGFDTIADCYGDLTDHIFAVETGLSSDPPMNWRLSMLDRYRLVSNSDAHSPGKLGREATTFETEVDYYAIRRALETGEGFAGTVEFFPEEGKYHHDGHRNCGVRLTPAETLAHGALCPRCQQPLTVGVLHRAEKLADRPEGCAPPPTAGAVANLVPLPEVLSEIVSSGPASKTVQRSYERLVSSLGPELAILNTVPTEEIARTESTLLAEAIQRLRAGQVIREAGYDGEYGVIRLFNDGELKRLTMGGRALFDTDAPPKEPQKKEPPKKASKPRATAKASAAEQATSEKAASEKDATDDAAVGMAAAPTAAMKTDMQPQLVEIDDTDAPSSPVTRAAKTLLAGLDADQRRAAETTEGPLLIVAGPGSGKTRTITHRIAHLVAERGVPAESCLAITFTRRAAGEMRERLARLLDAHGPRQAPAGTDDGTRASGVAIHTFHSLGLDILREQADAAGLPREFRIASEPDRVDALRAALDIAERKAQMLLRAISKAKRSPGSLDDDATLVEALAAYTRALAARGWLDFDDLVCLPVRLLSERPELAAHYRDRFRWISVDEFQDVDEQQYRLTTLLAPPQGNLCVIGDPNQAIYGFRGADASCFERFAQDYPSAATVALARNYRSTGTIVSAAAQVITTAAASASAGGTTPSATAESQQALARIVRGMHERITIQSTPTDRAEADFVVQTIERLMGGHSLHAIDQRRGPGAAGLRGAHDAPLGFADFAVLFRTDAQSAAIVEAFARAGIPFRKHAHEPLAQRAGVRTLLDELARLDEQEAGDAREPLTTQLRRASELADSCFTDAGADTDRDAAGARAEAVANRDTALQRLLTLAETCAGDRARFADAVAVASEADFWDPRADRVSLLTLHASKGLEFPIVFITGLEDGLLPFHWDTADAVAAAEERRLFYVGMTRARDRLFLSRAAQRLWRGRLRAQEPSPFLNDIEAELVKHQQTAAPRRKPEQRQLELL